MSKKIKKAKKAKKPPKLKVREAFPFSLTDVCEKLGIVDSCRRNFLASHPPQYKKGHTRRYKQIPEGTSELRKIVACGQVGKVVGAFSAPGAAIWTGPASECSDIIHETMRRWWTLPKGRELVTVCAERSRIKLAQKGKDSSK